MREVERSSATILLWRLTARSKARSLQIESIVALASSWSMIFSNLPSLAEAGFAKVGNRVPPPDHKRHRAPPEPRVYLQEESSARNRPPCGAQLLASSRTPHAYNQRRSCLHMRVELPGRPTCRHPLSHTSKGEIPVLSSSLIA
jgi:hypothetical protein